MSSLTASHTSLWLVKAAILVCPQHLGAKVTPSNTSDHRLDYGYAKGAARCAVPPKSKPPWSVPPRRPCPFLLLPARGDLAAALTPAGCPSRRSTVAAPAAAQARHAAAASKTKAPSEEAAFPGKHVGARHHPRPAGAAPPSCGGRWSPAGRPLRGLCASSGRFPASSPLQQSSCSPMQGGLLPLNVPSLPPAG